MDMSTALITNSLIPVDNKMSEREKSETKKKKEKQDRKIKHPKAKSAWRLVW